MKYIYLYVGNEQKKDCLKYGIKLSEYADKILETSSIQKRGIVAYLSPKDTEKYNLKEYSCLKIKVDDLNIFVYNRICESSEILNHQFLRLQDYTIGSFEDPVCLICSSILPENICVYNKIVDSPLIVHNSKEFFYEKAINIFLQDQNIPKEDIYIKILDLAITHNTVKNINTDENSDLIATTDKNGNIYVKKL